MTLWLIDDLVGRTLRHAGDRDEALAAARPCRRARACCTGSRSASPCDARERRRPARRRTAHRTARGRRRPPAIADEALSVATLTDFFDAQRTAATPPQEPGGAVGHRHAARVRRRVSGPRARVERRERRRPGTTQRDDAAAVGRVLAADRSARVQRDVALRILRPDVLRARPNQPVVRVLLEHVRRPARHAADREDRREQIDRRCRARDTSTPSRSRRSGSASSPP